MSNVQEAAARLRDGFNYVQCPDHWQECNDARTLAEAFLELVPADDAEPLDAPFVESVGLRWAKFGYYWPGWPAGMQINGVDGDAWLYVANEPIVSLKTRGDLRALLKGLKLPLSPAPRQEPT